MMNSYPKRLANGIEIIAIRLDGMPDSVTSKAISVMRKSLFFLIQKTKYKYFRFKQFY